jgi:hypothetical protein
VCAPGFAHDLTRGAPTPSVSCITMDSPSRLAGARRCFATAAAFGPLSCPFCSASQPRRAPVPAWRPASNSPPFIRATWPAAQQPTATERAMLNAVDDQVRGPCGLGIIFFRDCRGEAPRGGVPVGALVSSLVALRSRLCELMETSAFEAVRGPGGGIPSCAEFNSCVPRLRLLKLRSPKLAIWSRSRPPCRRPEGGIRGTGSADHRL